jgi:hypothetical protein
MGKNKERKKKKKKGKRSGTWVVGKKGKKKKKREGKYNGKRERVCGRKIGKKGVLEVVKYKRK